VIPVKIPLGDWCVWCSTSGS